MTSSNIFTAEQMVRMNEPPLANAVGSLNGNPYLKGKYIVAQLNDIIGQGNWSIQTQNMKTENRHVEKNITRNNVTTKVPTWYVGVELQVILTIYAADGSGRFITFSEPGIGNSECPINNNIYSAIDNAAASATTNGLKRCARYLGDAFGLTLDATANMGRPAPARSNYIQGVPARQVATPQQQTQRAAAPAARTNPPADTAVAAKPPVDKQTTPTASAGPGPATTMTHANGSAKEAHATVAAKASEAVSLTQPAATAIAVETTAAAPPAAPPAATPAAPPAAAPADSAAQTSAKTTPAAEENATASDKVKELSNWNLDIVPKTEEEWQRCARRLRERITETNHARVLQSLIEQRKNLITRMPDNFKPFITQMIDSRFGELKSSTTTAMILQTR